jgi:Uma2 family endonuclease
METMDTRVTFARDALYSIRRAEQIMGMPALDERRWTAREVRALIEDAPLATPRYELVDGELLVTPGPTGWHQLAVGRLLVELMAYVDAQGLGVVLASPSDVELEVERITQPDVYVFSENEWARVRTEGWPVRELLLAVEVLSPSSSRYDRVVKRPLYTTHVPEYWIVDIDARVIERWRRGEDRPEILSQRMTWSPDGAEQPLELDLKQFFARVMREQPR